MTESSIRDVNPNTLRALLRLWGIAGDVAIEGLGPEPHARFLILTPERRCFVLKRRSGRLDIEPEVWMLRLLAAQGLPVAPPLPTRQGDACASWELGADDRHYVCLYPYLPGNTLEEHYGPKAEAQARMFGRAIAQLHEGFRRLPRRPEFPTMDLVDQVFADARGVLFAKADKPTRTLLDAVYEALTAELLPAHAGLPQQLIHRDLHPGNMVVQEQEVTGFIDFEIATWGVRVFDLAYCSTSLLCAAAEDPARRRRWIGLLTHLTVGYTGVMPLAPVERELFWHVQLCIQLIFAAYYDSVEMPEPAQANLRMLHWIYLHKRAIPEAV